MAYFSIFTEEEVTEDMIDVLEMLKQGTPYKIMAEELGRSEKYIAKISKILVDEGKITKEELKIVRRKHMKEIKSSNKKIKEKEITSTEIKRKKREEKKEETLNLFKQGVPQAHIARKLQVPDTYIATYKKELIEEGRLSLEEVKKSSTKEYLNEEIFEKYVPEVLELLKKGIRPFAIRKIIGLSTYDSDIALEYIRRNKLISKEEIAKQIEIREKEDLKRIEEYVNMGYTRKRIIEEIPYISENILTRLLNTLIDQGNITKKQLVSNMVKANNEARNKERELSQEEQKAFVLKLAKQGYSASEIAKMDKTNSIDFEKASYMKKILMKDGLIDKEKSEKIKKERNNKKLKNKHKKEMKKIKQYVEQGYNNLEIAEFMGYERKHIRELIKEYMKTNEWYSSEEIKNFRKFKRENERKEKRLKEEEERRKEEQRTKNRHDLKIRALNEYNKEVGERILSVENRANYLKFLSEMKKQGFELDEKEILLAGELMLSNEELINKENLRLIVLEYNKTFGEEKTLKYLNRIASVSNKPYYTEKIEEIKTTVKKIGLKSKIFEMLKNGDSINTIAKKLDMYYSEVIKTINEDIKIEYDER